MARKSNTAASNEIPAELLAYLSTEAAPKQSLASVLADKLDNLTQRVAYRAGKAVESVSGSGDIFTLGKKVGAAAAAKRVEDFKLRAAQEIMAMHH